MSASVAALAGALLSTALAQVSYKAYFGRGGDATRRPLLLALAVGLFVSAALCSYLALRGLTLGVVYMSTALTHVMVAGLSWKLLGEKLTRDHGVGLALIAAGIVVYAS